MLKLRALILLFTYSASVGASILPSNNLAIPVSSKSEGLSEEQYHLVIDKVEAVYAPIVKEMGRKLTIKRLWESPVVNAGTIRSGKEIIIKLYGGYPRHEHATMDGYALVICHELGHHLGGTPRKIYDQTGKISWSSVEGQADYFATLKCLRKIFRGDNNLDLMKKASVPEIVRKKCSYPFKEDWEKALCMRTTLAGIDISRISAAMRGVTVPNILTPDEVVVPKTYEGHPAPQCRLDTYFQGSICEVSSFHPTSSDDERDGTCHPKNGHEEGNRPLCWFSPAER